MTPERFLQLENLAMLAHKGSADILSGELRECLDTITALTAQLREATADQPTMKLLTTVMDERDKATAQIAELQKRVEVANEALDKVERTTQEPQTQLIAQQALSTITHEEDGK